MKHCVQIIQCSSNRCDNCPNQSELGCQELVSRNQDGKKTTILIEKKRGLVHVRFSGNRILLEPPWSTDGWESIFIGKDNDLFHNVIDLVDIYRVGPSQHL